MASTVDFRRVNVNLDFTQHPAQSQLKQWNRILKRRTALYFLRQLKKLRLPQALMTQFCVSINECVLTLVNYPLCKQNQWLLSTPPSGLSHQQLNYFTTNQHRCTLTIFLWKTAMQIEPNTMGTSLLKTVYFNNSISNPFFIPCIVYNTYRVIEMGFTGLFW